MLIHSMLFYVKPSYYRTSRDLYNFVTSKAVLNPGPTRCPVLVQCRSRLAIPPLAAVIRIVLFRPAVA